MRSEYGMFGTSEMFTLLHVINRENFNYIAGSAQLLKY